ncbi:MAG TPA: hypothetical protein H9900_00390 [Candidatus Monoglobus merdigallinarum]|uniref:Uncharacterized protein n=1 Tax=Candidatus Monoglobus merdigallinarum TaxID=2838698 RepID=A0A9D1PP05_9FIRM|nr:hypothetical protein [Candidatus Monoglobus merdigallinarum]
MTLKNKRQVLIINDIRSDKIEQAIFILRDEKDSRTHGVESDIVLEAHRIINGVLYSPSASCGGEKKHKKLMRAAVWLLSAAAAALLMILLLT